MIKLIKPLVLHNYSQQGLWFRENSGDLNENVIEIVDELNNSSILKNGFNKPCKKAFIHNNSEPIIDVNIDPQFNKL